MHTGERGRSAHLVCPKPESSVQALLSLGGIVLVVLFVRFSWNGLLDRLPACDSDDARSKLISMARKNLSEKKIPFSSVEVVGARNAFLGGDGRACRAEIHVDGRRAVAIEYYIGWVARFISRYEVKMRAAAPTEL